MEGFEYHEVKTEIEEQFHAVAENLKSEETNTVDVKPEISSGDYEFQRPDDATEYLAFPLVCRLCTIPNNNMADIFGFDATSKSILSMINHCLPIMVNETDTLPKQVCQSCLGELERCYRFHQSVAEAEKQLRGLARLASDRHEETERYCDRQHVPTGGTLKRTSDDDPLSSPEYVETVDAAPVKWDDPLSTTETHHKSNSAIKKGKSSSDSVHRNTDSITVAFDFGTTTPSRIVQQSSCDSEDDTQGEKADNKDDSVIYKRSHDGERRYKCTICARTYKSKKYLAKHHKIHTGVGLYSCEYCGKKFLDKADRNYHHRIHTGEQAVKCSICEKTFTWASSLKLHLARFHSDRRDYPCPMCHKSFKTSSNRRSHVVAMHDM